jgi:hypothetical protein
MSGTTTSSSATTDQPAASRAVRAVPRGLVVGMLSAATAVASSTTAKTGAPTPAGSQRRIEASPAGSLVPKGKPRPVAVQTSARVP